MVRGVSASTKMQQVVDAIIGYSPNLLESTLSSLDPNQHLPGVNFLHQENYIKPNDWSDEEYKERIDIRSLIFGAYEEETTAFVSLLHIAVYSCERAAKAYDKINEADALRIVDILIAFHLKHADVPRWSKQYHLGTNTVVFNTFRMLYTFYDNQSPQHFAVNLKARLSSNVRTLSACIDKLLKYETDLNAKLTRPKGPVIAGIPMKSIPKSVYNIWQSLLFSEKYADVIFEVTDESVSPPTVSKLYAHRALLASSSDYFDVMLSGKWKETQSSSASHATIKVNQTLDVNKCLLAFIYTGTIDTAIVSNHSLELLDLAAQGQYDALTSLCELEAIKNITTDNVMSMLLSSYRYELKHLKGACFDFIKSNAAQLMFSDDLLNLKTTHKKIFNDIKRSLGHKVDDNDEESDVETVDKASKVMDTNKAKTSNDKKRTSTEANNTSTTDSVNKRTLRSTVSEANHNTSTADYVRKKL